MPQYYRLSIQRDCPLDFIRPFLVMIMTEQAHHCSSGLTKPFADERVLLWSLMRGGCSVHPINKGIFSRKRLQELLQSFAWADAKLCEGECKALQGRMQSFAWADAKLCVGGCKALRLRWAKLARKSSVLFWIREKGGTSHHKGHYSSPRN